MGGKCSKQITNNKTNKTFILKVLFKFGSWCILYLGGGFYDVSYI